MEQVLSRALVGRDGALRRLDAVVAAAVNGRGGGLALLGEAGIGKSRLSRELEGRARERGVLVLAGRAVEAAAEPFRSLTDALQDGFRRSGLPMDPSLLPLRPTLAHLVSAWSSSLAGDVSVLGIAEALLRLLEVAGRGCGALLVIDDLHWADPDTLTILEYVVDHADAHGAGVVVTLRPEPTPALRTVRSLAARRATELVELGRLSADQVAELVRSCLTSEAAPAEVVRFVQEHGDGVPFLVEELLAGLVRDGILVRDAAGWRLATHRLTPSVPATLAASVERRLRTLGPPDLEVLFAAALLGHRIDWRLLPLVTDRSDADIAASLREARHAQLLTGEGDDVRFRHALTRHQVLEQMLPYERRRLAGRALDVVVREHPGLPGPWCDLAADLAEIADERDRAAAHLVTAAERAGAHGALSTAAARLERARNLAVDPEQALRVDEQLARVYALAGHVERAIALGDAALRRRRARDGTQGRAVDLELALARAALAAGQRQRAALRVAGARQHAAALGDDVRRTRAVSLGAQIAVESGQLDEAETLAEQALAASDGLPEVECEAWETLGRCHRVADVARAERDFAAALTCAERHDLAVWRARALHELGTVDLLDTMRTDRLEAARRAAVEAGAAATAAVVDFHLALCLVASGETEAGRAAALRSIAVAERLGLSILAPAYTVLARSYAHERREEPMEAAVARAEAAAPDDPTVRAAVDGTVHAMLALHRADLAAARAALESATAMLREAAPGEHFPHWGWWALLRARAGDGVDDGRAVLASAAGRDTRLNRAHALAMEAVVCGRSRDRARAEELFDEAMAVLAAYERADWLVHTTQWVVAPAAIADGWGRGVDWLQAGVRWFDAHGHDPLARSCRALLRDAGAPVPRRGRGSSAVPDRLREQGVTSREMDVLLLVAEGLSNRRIADRMVLSPRTVEKHLASLLRKTGSSDRRDLAHLVPPEAGIDT